MLPLFCWKYSVLLFFLHGLCCIVKLLKNWGFCNDISNYPMNHWCNFGSLKWFVLFSGMQFIVLIKFKILADFEFLTNKGRQLQGMSLKNHSQPKNRWISEKWKPDSFGKNLLFNVGVNYSIECEVVFRKKSRFHSSKFCQFFGWEWFFRLTRRGFHPFFG